MKNLKVLPIIALLMIFAVPTVMDVTAVARPGGGGGPGATTPVQPVPATIAVDNRPAGDGVVDLYAVIIGISDYKAISDLSYCDEDASDWYNYLAPLGYQITVLGDNHPENYPQYDGLATEYNIKAAVAALVSVMDADDIFVYATSGHGSESQTGGSGRTKTYAQVICCWDSADGENGESGYLFDTEMQEMFADIIADTFIFVDHCFGGGFYEVMLNAAGEGIPWFYMTTTCTDDGYGYDYTTVENGAWTYFFLEFSLINHFGGSASMEDAFDYALANYLWDGGDTPWEFDYNNNPFYL